MEFADEVHRVLVPHGSFVIEIGGAFQKGWPKRSTYQSQLLSRLVEEGDFDLAQDFYWYNPAKLPNPIERVKRPENTRYRRGHTHLVALEGREQELCSQGGRTSRGE